MNAPEQDAPFWQRYPAERGRRRGRPPITREAIVETALRLLDRDGLDQLSMRRVADALDTGPASLYWHVGSKDGLLDLIFDRVIGEQEVPDPDPERWQEQVKEIAANARATILRHRDIVRISIGRYPMGPNALRHTERALAVLRAGGVPDRLAVTGLWLLFAVVNGFTLDETVDLGTEGAQPVSQELANLARDYLASLPADRFPNLVAVADHWSVADSDSRFELLIDLFVEGLAKRAEAERDR
ncbi:MAG TPA: TetR/AcrR family transcriptional regulator [Gaiellaceae bacterium]|nr:TetR/AcrR family transcriptional regulator [Gaiellaceae bacterium]